MKNRTLTCAHRRGFTFVEILAAMLFMAIVIPVAMNGLMLANKVGTGAARKRHAMELADRVMNQALATDSWRYGDEAGDFGEEWPGYRWEVTEDAWSEDTMSTVRATVYYSVQGQELQVSLETLAPEEAEKEADAETGTGSTE